MITLLSNRIAPQDPFLFPFVTNCLHLGQFPPENLNDRACLIVFKNASTNALYLKLYQPMHHHTFAPLDKEKASNINDKACLIVSKGVFNHVLPKPISNVLLAPQGGALRISVYRDFHSIQSQSQSHPLIAFQHLSLSMVIWDSASRPWQINVDQVRPKQVSILRNFTTFKKFQKFQKKSKNLKVSNKIK